ncbi:hypothetical protein ACMG5L_24420 [Escherichia coli]|uniref:hypothetical protein n=1 Tax=Escherichia coli TaxID=562 RepID=UPI0039BF782D
MSWFDRKFFTLEEVLDLPCDSSKEKLVNMQQSAYLRDVNGYSQFHIGDRVELVMKADPDNEASQIQTAPIIYVPGVVIGIRFTASQVNYDIAIPIEGCELFMVLNNFRGNMRTIDGGKKTCFIEERLLSTLAKRELGAPNLRVIENE